MSDKPTLSREDRARKAKTRAALKQTLASLVGDVQTVKPSKRRPSSAADVIGREMPELRARADAWLEARGLPTSTGERGDDVSDATTQQHLGRIVHTRSGAKGRRSRVVSPHTGKLLGEQG